MTVIDWFVKLIFWFWLTVWGVALTDIAIDLQNTTIKAYQKGPISAGAFTKMLTDEKPLKK